MRKYLILFFALAIGLWGFSFGGVFAEERHHNEEEQHHEEGLEDSHSAGSKATFTKENSGYRYILSVSPEHLRVGEETELELEIMDMRYADENLGEGFPVTNAEVIVRLKELSTNREVRVHAHAEADAGVYGIHHEFLLAGDYQVLLEITKRNGTKLSTHFDIEVHERNERGSRSGEKHHRDEREERGNHH